MSKNIEVTDHAIIRWLERYYDIDVNKIRGFIKEEIKKYSIKNINGKFPIGNQCKAVVIDGTVITVIKRPGSKYEP